MKLIVGLGNPGPEYQLTPHNMGFLAVDRVAERNRGPIRNRHGRALTGKVHIGPELALLAKPETYMNLSGMAVRELVREYGIEPAKDLVVVHDELDFDLGTLRIRERGGSAGHNGVESIIAALGSAEFTRVRLGVAPGHKVADGAEYVLTPFRKAQWKVADEVVTRAAEAIEMLVTEGVAKAMNRFNQKTKAQEE